MVKEWSIYEGEVMAKRKQSGVGALMLEAWGLTQRHAKLLYTWLVVVLGVQFLLHAWAGIYPTTSGTYWAIISMAALLLAFFQVALTRALLRLVRGKKVVVGDMFWVDPEAFGAYLMASMFYGVAVAVGLVALIVPGIMLGLLYSQYLYLIVDKHMGVVESLTASVTITRGYLLFLLEYLMVAAVLLAMGVLVLGVGLLVVTPVVVVAGFLVYEQLLTGK